VPVATPMQLSAAPLRTTSLRKLLIRATWARPAVSG
jgi:hypothetical protein